MLCKAPAKKKLLQWSHSPKSTSGTAGYGNLHGPILLEEQEGRSMQYFYLFLVLQGSY